ncbi:hypothetical protein LOTGIDRAFT_184042 [Lottia gigantea]|uniref:Tetraspanin n=1 Tax=Lottia gigantea TaxID=225164 RepID=V3Z0K5_LOTGI|nr:hypothetical protein LOTGIDRAFT_184042 [Lottia gigantea]ESO84008.1 hypothetical protein LOTGIDRAFT_184042 [Lottia gigantea]
MTLESDHRCCECSFWAKYVLFGFNFLVWVAGIVLIAIGIWARLQKEGLDPLDHLVTDPAYILIAVGVVMFFISFFGCIGALRENVTLLKIFCIVVVIIFILQVIAGVLAFVFVDSIEKQVLDYMKHSLEHYDDNADINDLVDQIQKQYKCCGAASYNDWEVNFYYNCSSTAVSRCGVPSSCCRQLGNSGVQCGYNSRRHGEQYANAVIYITGCIHPLMTVFQDNLVIIGLLAFCVGFIELFSLLLAHYLMRNIMLNNKLLN